MACCECARCCAAGAVAGTIGITTLVRENTPPPPLARPQLRCSTGDGSLRTSSHTHSWAGGGQWCRLSTSLQKHRWVDQACRGRLRRAPAPVSRPVHPFQLSGASELVFSRGPVAPAVLRACGDFPTYLGGSKVLISPPPWQTRQERARSRGRRLACSASIRV